MMFESSLFLANRITTKPRRSSFQRIIRVWNALNFANSFSLCLKRSSKSQRFPRMRIHIIYEYIRSTNLAFSDYMYTHYTDRWGIRNTVLRPRFRLFAAVSVPVLLRADPTSSRAVLRMRDRNYPVGRAGIRADIETHKISSLFSVLIKMLPANGKSATTMSCVRKSRPPFCCTAKMVYSAIPRRK